VAALILLTPTGHTRPTVPKSGHVRTIGGPNGPVVVQVVGFGPLGGNRLWFPNFAVLPSCHCKSYDPVYLQLSPCGHGSPPIYISQTQKWRNKNYPSSNHWKFILADDFPFFFFKKKFINIISVKSPIVPKALTDIKK
jgi:hypothetical protein